MLEDVLSEVRSAAAQGEDPPAEEVLLAGGPSSAAFRAAAEAAIVDPFTVPGTAFKVELAKRTIVRALETAAG